MNRGYAFRNAHVKLGSKIHVKDFYFGRHIFQNSYYALRSAFLVAERIVQHLLVEKDATGNIAKGLTIFINGMYSELLASNIRGFVEDRLQNIKAEFIVDVAIYDDEKTKHSGVADFQEKFFILVPIASTLSTGEKMLRYSSAKWGTQSKLLGAPLNIILVGHLELKEIIDDEGKVTDEVVKTFWKEVNPEFRTILPARSEVVQEYLVYVPSRWYRVNNCPLCLPENDPLEEQILYNTRRASLVPPLLLEFPQAKTESNDHNSRIRFSLDEVNESGNSFSLINRQTWNSPVFTSDMLQYGHFSRGRNHYLYYVDTVRFFDKNHQLVDKWLTNIRNNVLKDLSDDESVLIISPAHPTNSSFVNTVNKKLFNSTAAVYHHDSGEFNDEQLDRFLLNAGGEKSKIFFIDDALCSGSTFSRLSSRVAKRRTTSGQHRGFDGAFVLLNRLLRDTHMTIMSRLGQCFYSFAMLEAPVMTDPERNCFLCHAEEEEKKLFEKTVLDSTKIRSARRLNILRSKSLTEETEVQVMFEGQLVKERNNKLEMGSGTPKRYLHRLKLEHNLLHALSKDKVKRIFREASTTGTLTDLLNNIGGNVHERYHRVNLLKLISLPQFSFHHSIRSACLSWTLVELKTAKCELNELINQQQVSQISLLEYASKLDDLLRYIKFIIRCLSHLRSNYLVRKELLDDIYELHRLLDCVSDQLKTLPPILDIQINEKGKNVAPFPCIEDKQQMLPMLNNDTDLGRSVDKSETEPPYLRLIRVLSEFNVFFTYCVKSVVWNDETKTLHLEKTLNKYKPHEIDNQAFRSLIRMLRLENVNPIQYFLDLAVDSLSGEKLSFSYNAFESDVAKVLNIIKSVEIFNTHRVEPFIQMLGILVDNPNGNVELGTALVNNDIFRNQFIPLILLKLFLRKDHNATPEATAHLKYVLFLLSQALGFQGEDVGAFCLVRYASDPEKGHLEMKAAVAARIDSSNKFLRTKSALLDNQQVVHSLFAHRMLEGKVFSESILPWTNYEVVQRDGRYFGYDEIEFTSGFEEGLFFPDAKHFLFIRLSLDEPPGEPTGIMSFYRNENDFIDLNILKFTLCLRHDLSSYINKNFDNDSFRQHLAEESRRSAVSTMGHGVKALLEQLHEIANVGISNDILAKKYENLHQILYRKTKLASIDLTSKGVERIKSLDLIGFSTESVKLHWKLFNEIKPLLELQFDVKVIYECNDNLFRSNNYHFPAVLLQDILAEYAYNAYKKLKLNPERIMQLKELGDVPTLRIEVINSSANSNQHQFSLEICDNIGGVTDYDLALLNKIGYLKSGGGLDQSFRLWRWLNEDEPPKYESESSSYFKIILPWRLDTWLSY